MKIINPDNKGGYNLEKLNTHAKLTTFDHLQLELSKLKCYECAEYQYGYICPGHGLKGKQKPLVTNEDIDTMYCDCKGKNITLWVKCCWQHQRKHALSPSHTSNDTLPKSKRSNYDTHLQRMSEVELIVDKLKKTHKDGYSAEQLRAWAHMIEMKRHESYDVPPDKPFFRKSRSTVLRPTETCGVSPGKRINMRSECIDQLDKWHRLMERGAISPEQYSELQKTILADIKKF